MLQTQTVEGTTFELLKKLMQDNKLSQFNLAGGTALALYMGHRMSIDLDLFTPQDFNASALEEYLIDTYNFRGDYLETNTLKGTINGIKIDCITHNYPFVKPLFISEEGIRLYSIQDIVAMKLSAIADNGTRLKDFIDIACLSTKLSIYDMLQSYQAKYKNSNPVRALKGLTYFEDINFNEPILMLKGKFNWKRIEKRLNEMIKKDKQIFATLPIA